MNKKIRIGHIGTKHDHSLGKLECVLKFPDLFEVVGVVEEDPIQRAYVQNIPPYQGLPFMTEAELFDRGIDCALIEGFEYDLPYAALRCVENGIAVHIDKPAGRELSVFSKNLRIAKAKGLPVQMAYMYRYNPAVQDCLQMVRAGRLGEIFSVYATMNTGHSAEKRQWLDRFDEGGIMFFLGCHMVDLIHLFQGTPKEIVPYLSSSGIGGTTAIDQATVIFRYDTGTSFAQANACEINGYGRRQLVVCGSEGTYEIHPLECPIRAVYTHTSGAHCYEDRHTVRNIVTTPRDARYDEMMLDFAAMVRGEKQNPFSYEYELQTQRMVLASCGWNTDWRNTISMEP